MLFRVSPSAPALEDLRRASEVVEALALEGLERARLRAEALEDALELLANRAVSADPSVRLLGQPLTEKPLRQALEEALRQMARLESDRARQIELIDRANAVRPVTWV